jgi:DNA-binding YbaB/EbfC family protein
LKPTIDHVQYAKKHGETEYQNGNAVFFHPKHAAKINGMYEFINFVEKKIMFGDMMEKLQAMKQTMAESKTRLATITVEGKADGVTVLIDGNRKVKDIQVDPALISEVEDLQDLLIVAVNRAIEAADKANESEMGSKAQDLLGGMGM